MRVLSSASGAKSASSPRVIRFPALLEKPAQYVPISGRVNLRNTDGPSRLADVIRPDRVSNRSGHKFGILVPRFSAPKGLFTSAGCSETAGFSTTAGATGCGSVASDNVAMLDPLRAGGFGCDATSELRARIQYASRPAANR
jgi:hypothetical protein